VSAARLAFIHGGVHTGQCWDDTVDAITALRPDVECMAVDLPGRRLVPGDLARLTIEDCVTAVAEQINAQGDGPVVLVGHSLAGVLLAGVADRLGGDRAQQVIFVTCCVPRNGECVIDTLAFGFRQIVWRIANRSPVIDSPPWLVRHVFANAATPEQRAKIKANVVPESAALITQASAAEWPAGIRKSWVLTRRDRALPPGRQRGFIRNVGGVDDVVAIDAGHEVMITHPTELANALLQLTFSPASTATDRRRSGEESSA
jgi:pimeloyl-ACP methyl ester carboxylesterase